MSCKLSVGNGTLDYQRVELVIQYDDDNEIRVTLTYES
jgi:hypothetical protein